MAGNPANQIPWTTELGELRDLERASKDSVCCVFTVADTIPPHAHKGYATLVMAYARQSEPIAILDDGSAVLLVTSGGTTAAHAVAKRILTQLEKLGLKDTIRIGIAKSRGDGDTVARAQSAAARAELGQALATP